VDFKLGDYVKHDGKTSDVLIYLSNAGYNPLPVTVRAQIINMHGLSLFFQNENHPLVQVQYQDGLGRKRVTYMLQKHTVFYTNPKKRNLPAWW